MNTPGSILKKRLSSVIRRPSVWMPLLLIVIGIASIIPAAWDAYRAHTIGWVGAIDNTQDRLDEIEQYDGDWSRKYSYSFWTYAPSTIGNASGSKNRSMYLVGLDTRAFAARTYRVDGNIIQPKLETTSIGYVKHFVLSPKIVEPISSVPDSVPIPFAPDIAPIPLVATKEELLEPPYSDEVIQGIDRVLLRRIRMSRSFVLPAVATSPLSWQMIRHDGVMEPRAILDEDGKPTRNDEGELELTPVHAFSYYRVTHGTLQTPMTWERFWVQAWGVLMWTMPMPMAAYAIGYIGCYCLYFKRRTRKRLKLGLCIKCAYPMQEDRDGEGMICTECGYLDHADTLNP